MFDSVAPETVRNLAGTLLFCAVFVVAVRLRPWRWLSSWVRRG